MVELSLSSKRFNCNLKLKEKVTFVVGDSAKGKTEMVRRLSSGSSSKSISISSGYSYEVLTGIRFSDLCNNVIRNIRHSSNISLDEFNALDDKTKKKYFCDYWRDKLNFPFTNSIIIIDDEDFVDTLEFQAFFDCDYSNYYLIINRLHLDKIGYSVSEVYNYKADGVNHYLEKRYELPATENKNFDYIVTEGVGSDYIFFKRWLGYRVINPTFNGKLKSGGRTNVVKMIEENKEIFRNKTILVLIDYVAFGSNFASLLSICNDLSINFCIKSSYQSFEYLLLRSNIISDTDLDIYINENRLKFSSLETLYTSRLEDLTKGTLLSYKKKANEFSICYYKDCCFNNNYRNDNCNLRVKFHRKNKFVELLKGTEFENFLQLLECKEYGGFDEEFITAFK